MRRHHSSHRNQAPKVRVNRQIRAREVRVIDNEGNQLGIMHPRDAYMMAQEKGLDLVEVAPMAKPPVCRILDYGKYMYQQSKRQHEAKKHQKMTQVKEVKFRPKIDQHDYEFKKKHILRFLKEENKVKATIMFRGREITHSEIGRQILEQLMEELADVASVERMPKLEGYNMTMILAPAKK